MIKLKFLTWLCVFILSTIANNQTLTMASQEKLVISGSSTMAPLIAEIGKRFENLHPGTRVDVQTGGSSRGIADTVNGLADIGMVSRALKPQEHALHRTAIAHDGITMILHKDNPVNELSNDQIRSIYSGVITNWKTVGGPDAPITVVNKAEGRSRWSYSFSIFNYPIASFALTSSSVIMSKGLKQLPAIPTPSGMSQSGQHSMMQLITSRLSC